MKAYGLLVLLLFCLAGCTTALEAIWLKELLQPDRSVQNASECRTISMILYSDCQKRTDHLSQEEVARECQIFFPLYFDRICCSTKKDGCAPMF